MSTTTKKASPKKKAEKKEIESKVDSTTGITLQVPSALYFHIKGKADKETLKSGSKKTIHDKMIDDLTKANPDFKEE